MNKWLFIWLIFVAGWYLIPWWNRVYFLWDDIELLMQLRNPALSDFLSSHQYQFFPVFKLFYWLEVQLFGVNPAAFLAISVILHLINIYLIHQLIKLLTGSRFWGLIAAVLVSFNKSYFTVIFWPTIQSNVLLTTWLLLAMLLFFELKQKLSLNKLVKFLALISLAGLSFGFGIGAGFIFGIASWLFIKNRIGRILAVSSIITGVATVLVVLKFSLPEVQQAQIFSPSGTRLFNIAYFTAVGVSQGIISRFFIPGFIPNIHSPTNIAVMIVLPAIVLIFFLWTIFKNIKTPARLAPLFLFGSFVIVPYFIASLARSRPGALGGIAERYIYPPFFFFILALVYALYLISRQRKFPTYMIKLILPGAVAILSIGQQIVMHFEVSRLFL